MATYSEALDTWLSQPGRTQAKLADAIGKTQVAVSRYCSGDRFPDSATARAIDAATAEAVPFSLWQADAAARFGLDTEAA